MNIRKFAIAFASCAAFAVVSAYAQDDEVTSFEDFDEPVVESSATNGDTNANASVSSENAATNGVASASASSEDVTKLDLLSVETESEAEQAAIAKKQANDEAYNRLTAELNALDVALNKPLSTNKLVFQL